MADGGRSREVTVEGRLCGVDNEEGMGMGRGRGRACVVPFFLFALAGRGIGRKD